MSPELTQEFLTRDLRSLMREAAALRDAAFGERITFSKKVFIPLTHLCRDTCGYCTFVHPPRRGEAAYLTPEQVLEIARAGQAAGFHFSSGLSPRVNSASAQPAAWPARAIASTCSGVRYAASPRRGGWTKVQ